MKRAIATITVYVYGETEEELKQSAKNTVRFLEKNDWSQEPSLEKLNHAPFGKIGEENHKEIDLSIGILKNFDCGKNRTNGCVKCQNQCDECKECYINQPFKY